MLRVECIAPDDQPIARQWRDLVDAQDVDLLAGQPQLHGFVVDEARRGIDRTLRDRRALPEVGIEDDVEVVGGQVRGSQQRLEHDPRGTVAAGDPELPAGEVIGISDARRGLREDHRRETPVDGRDILDRDAVAHGRDDAGPIGEADIDRPLPDEGHEIRVDLVLECDVEPGFLVVPGLIGTVELRELDARDEAEPDRQRGQVGRRLADEDVGAGDGAGWPQPEMTTAITAMSARRDRQVGTGPPGMDTVARQRAPTRRRSTRTTAR